MAGSQSLLTRLRDLRVFMKRAPLQFDAIKEGLRVFSLVFCNRLNLWDYMRDSSLVASPSPVT
jgi:hypothetical protein